jgi:S1-C subfamily serine protease
MLIPSEFPNLIAIVEDQYANQPTKLSQKYGVPGMSEDVTNISEQFADAVERAASSTVTVHGRRRRPASGTVWSVNDGQSVIVTASHVVEREDRLAIGIDGDTVEVSLLGRDVSRDIAILSADSTALSAISQREREARVGTLVLAVGYIGSRQISASFGVVNSIGSLWSRRRASAAVVYSDVTMLPGFSGGALIDAAGSAVGINTSGLTRDGSGVTIPAAQITRIANEIVQFGQVRNGWIGITSQAVDLPEQARESVSGQEVGLLIVGVAPDSPAATAGLFVGDILVSLGEHPTADASDLQHLLGGNQIGQPLSATILRGGTRQSLEVVPTVRPEHRTHR